MFYWSFLTGILKIYREFSHLMSLENLSIAFGYNKIDPFQE